MKTDAGMLRVDGHLLPGRAAWVRARVGVALLAEPDAATQAAEALRGRTGLVVLDGIDRLTSAERDQVAARLRDAGPDVAVFVTAADADSARSLLVDAGRTAASVVDLRDPAPFFPASVDTPSDRPDPSAATPAEWGLDDGEGSRRSDLSSDTTEVTACDVLSERSETK
jgi:RND superfamily putative drug exporter